MSATAEPDPTPKSDVAQIPKIVRRLHDAFRSGRTRPIEWRLGQLERLGALLREHEREICEALHADLRKPKFEAWFADLATVQMEIDLARRSLRRWTRPEKVRTPLSQRPARAWIVREPLGVALIIAPWNYPVQLLLSPLVGAIAAGNCAVAKPSEVTAHTSAVLGRLLPEYLDPECIACVEGGVPETTALLAERFDTIFYTGNGRVARVVMEAAARHLTPVTLELGGKSPCIVDRSADLDTAARRIAWGKFLNAGQTCVAPDYVLVHQDCEGALLERLEGVLREFYGKDPHATPDYARIVNRRHHRRLAELLKAGEVVAGGQTNEEDCYIAPTILRGVSPDSELMREEIFGPILPVLRVADASAAVDLVSSLPKPLALYLFADDEEVERAVLEGTSSGGVCVNATLWHLANPALPFGGVGPSGMGAYHGRHTFETFSHRRAVVKRSTRFDPRIAYPPYRRLKAALVRRFM